MNIQNKFEKFLTEGTGSAIRFGPKVNHPYQPGVRDTDAVDGVVTNAANVQEPGTIEKLNGWLAALSATPTINPYYLIKRVQDKLALIGLHFDTPHMTGDTGRVTRPLTQFGGTYGYKPDAEKANEYGYPEIDTGDGIKDRLPGGMDIEITWVKHHGLTTLEAELKTSKVPTKYFKEEDIKECKECGKTPCTCKSMNESELHGDEIKNHRSTVRMALIKKGFTGPHPGGGESVQYHKGKHTVWHANDMSTFTHEVSGKGTVAHAGAIPGHHIGHGLIKHIETHDFD